MISRTDFTRGFALLMDRFGRTLGEPTIAEYHRILTAELDTDSFNRAVTVIFREDVFFPSPQRFIDAVRGDPKRLAEEAWTAILDSARRGVYPPLETLPEATRAALRVAPLREIMLADSDSKLGRLKREFIEAHVHAAGAALAALPGVPELTQ